MTQKEQESVDRLYNLLSKINSENNSFREDVKSQIDTINSKNEKKHLPIYLEQDILKTAQTSIQDAIKSVFSGYNSPLSKLITSVVDENSKELRTIISDSFTTVIRTDEFKKSIIEAFSHKVARSIISNNDGLFDKVSNELKQDAIFKSRMAIAVSNVVNECLLEKKIN